MINQKVGKKIGLRNEEILVLRIINIQRKKGSKNRIKKKIIQIFSQHIE